MGTVTIDTTLGSVLSVDFTTSSNPCTAYAGGDAEADPSGVYYLSATWIRGGSCYIGVNVVLPVASLVGYDGGPVCSDAYSCIDGQSSNLIVGDAGRPIDLLDGELSTPEPSGLVLLGTGMLGLLGGIAYRRRKILPGV
jgi:hypothetical protein